MFLPGVLTRQEVTVEPYAGDGAYGPTYAPGYPLRCRLDEQRRLVRAPNGDEVVSEVTLWAHADATVATGALVTLADDRKATVLVTKVHQGLSRSMAREVVLV